MSAPESRSRQPVRSYHRPDVVLNLSQVSREALLQRTKPRETTDREVQTDGTRVFVGRGESMPNFCLALLEEGAQFLQSLVSWRIVILSHESARRLAAGFAADSSAAVPLGDQATLW